MTFQIMHSWIEPREQQASALSASLARLTITINQANVTEYVEDDGSRRADLQIPIYYLAEWLAEHFWAILFEPRKTEDADPSFLARHSIAAAEDGFPLPNILFIPYGRSIQIAATPRKVPFANVTFGRRVSTFVRPRAVEQIFREFLSDCVSRLTASGITATPLEHLWGLIVNTSEDERLFCELAGALGLSPYNVSGSVTQALQMLVNNVGARATRDLCLATYEDQIANLAARVVRMYENMSESVAVNLEPLLSVELPEDSIRRPSWSRGVRAARNVRDQLGIRDDDAGGIDRLFEDMNIRVNHRLMCESDGLTVTGAIDRRNDRASIGLLQDKEEKRRFSAARAAYLGWVSESQSKRLVTNALTRDQQASRAFAAELLVPAAYIRKYAVGNKLRQYQIWDIAATRRAAADVVEKQAINNNIRVVYA